MTWLFLFWCITINQTPGWEGQLDPDALGNLKRGDQESPRFLKPTGPTRVLKQTGMDWLGEVLKKLNWGVSSSMVPFVPVDFDKINIIFSLSLVYLSITNVQQCIYTWITILSVFCLLSPESNENSQQSVIYTMFKMICLDLIAFCGGNDSGGNYILNVFEKEWPTSLSC